MGINGLWKLVEPAGVTYYLPDYCHSRTIKKQDINGPASIYPVLGIDASIWMHETQAIFHNRHHSSMGKNPELRTLLFRLCGLLEMTNKPVFVFDGPERPERKRGHKVIKTNHWIAVEFRKFIEACGFDHHQALGEAEAELAVLNNAGRVDIILSPDGDTLVYGGKDVAKSARDSTTPALQKSTRHRIHVYHMDRIRTHPEVDMTLGGLLLVALMVGGDYDPIGIAGCGGAVAKGLAAAGFGDSLRQAFLIMTPANFNTFRTQWRLDLCTELKTNRSGRLPRKQPALSLRIPVNFPDVKIVRLYTKPEVSPPNILCARRWTFQDVDVPRLARLCEKHFSWDATEIAAKFRSRVFGGLALRQLAQYDELGTSQAVEDAAQIAPSLFRVVRRARTTDTRPSSHYIVHVYINHLQMMIPLALEENHSGNPIPADDLSTHFVDFHAPAYLVEPIRPLLTLGKYSHQKQSARAKGSKTGKKQEKGVTKGKEVAREVIELSDDDTVNEFMPLATTSAWSAEIELSDSDSDFEMSWPTLSSPLPATEVSQNGNTSPHASTSTRPPVIELSDSDDDDDDDDRTPPATISTWPLSKAVPNQRSSSINNADLLGIAEMMSSRNQGFTRRLNFSFCKHTGIKMAKAPSASVASQKSRRSFGKKTKNDKSEGKTTVIDDASLDDLMTLQLDSLEKYGQPKRTRDEYVRYRKRSREFLKEYVQKRQDEKPAQRDGINNDKLAKAFDKIPNRYSAYACAMFITQKCINEENGISTAQGIHGAWCDEWDNADETRYSGAYSYDAETNKVTGCPARASEVTKLMRAIKNRGGQKGAAATRHHAEAMLYEDISRVMQKSNETHPIGMMSTASTSTLLAEILKHVMFRAFLTTGFILWTRNCETSKIQWRDITLNCIQDGHPYIRVHLENRKGWQKKYGWEGPPGTNTYHIYKQDLDDIDMYTHLLAWIAILKKELGREFQDDDYLFPSISTNGTINPKQPMTREYVQHLLSEFTHEAGVERYYSTHCLRRGGAQYRMIFAPIEQRWDIHRVRWWGGWAEGESVDTLMKYLLDALQSYESGHADALAPKAKSGKLSKTDDTADLATKADIKEMENTLLCALEGLELQRDPKVAPYVQANANVKVQPQRPATQIVNAPAPAPSWQPTYHLVSDPKMLVTSTTGIGSSYVPMLVLNCQPNFASLPMHSLHSQKPPIWQPTMSGRENLTENLPSSTQSTPIAAASNAELTPMPLIHRHPDLPRAGLHIPHLNRNDPKAWLAAVRQWEVGIPEENIPPLRDWDQSWYKGKARALFGTKRHHRQLIAEEFYRLGRCEKAFEKLYGHHKGTGAIVAAIQSAKPGVKRRRSKNGFPEERDALL
ncbi:hypothetical protein CPB83DRAFT_880296 [Crepidotus variabilis]|uniref:XPG-I domain-containing protein n=1 Tax=Crepidotus variabilis TaxID=179855 RepID=A0A9P6ENP9_9AGAR|nr:hypothetical protein CPB83DRAFT_880296 [Crepidotus variabilis]